MFRLTFKNLRANKIRFALTTFGVTLAVSFVVAAFVLADGLRSTFSDVSAEITAGIDLEVRPSSEFGDPEPLGTDMTQIVAGIDGVADAVPSIEAAEDSVRPVLADGSTIDIEGPPQLAYAWIDNESISPFAIVDGAPPSPGEFTLDYDSVAEHGFAIGDSYEFVTPTGRYNLTLSGTTSFGSDNDTVGATLMQMNSAEAGQLFGIDGLTSVQIEAADGVDIAGLQAAVTSAVSEVTQSAEVVDNATVLAEQTQEFNGDIDIVGNILLGFGGVALFVSIFIIYNTFAIVLGQRIRELALLRTIGADPKQIRRSVMSEALIIGVLASIGGIAGGVAVSKGLEALFNSGGGSLPDSPLILSARTLIAAVVIGLGVTIVAAIGPARKASTIPAIAAMNGADDDKAPGSRTRIFSGTGFIGAGIVVGTFGLAGTGGTSTTVALMAAGAMSVFIGVTLLSPMAVQHVTRLLGWPLAVTSGVAGKLARQNSARNPRRTATTAAALMIGLTLVTAALVIGESIKTSLGSTMQESVNADYLITTQLGDVTFPTSLADDLDRSELIDAVTGFRYTEAEVNADVSDVAAADLAKLDALIDVSIETGALDTEATNPVIVSDDRAATDGYVVGDIVTTEFANGTVVDATIIGTFSEQSIIFQDYLFDVSVFDGAQLTIADEWLALSTAPDADHAAIGALIDGVAALNAHADVETADEFRERLEGSIDEVLSIVNVMVALAVIIALIGIANTLALSVVERTRELGLVRAVGMSRRQLRRMVRFEAALVATFGAVLGVGVGLLFGWSVTQALPGEFASAVAVPVGSIVTLVVIAALAGVVAAWLPARRAGRLNVLDAIAAS